MSRARTALFLFLCSLAALFAGAFIRAHAAPTPSEFLAYDQPAYLSLARQPFIQTPAVYPPASWRILPPLAARVLGDLVGGGPERGFLVLTFGCFVLMPIAAFAWLGALGVDASAVARMRRSTRTPHAIAKTAATRTVSFVSARAMTAATNSSRSQVTTA